ncbi:threonine--tRNA ligase [Nocardioides sp. Root1257]|uniref:threonine--tRNA ligase n=1 Tax=unclassified Nocardioides TaxID=2615069 RepID=UPI000700AC14|nr:MULTISPECIES: threonine--tRNA ligase [unclassified Nocardioides]KQW43022.1 threonine--tRNA ligase [Nocardioides sp. Root1257]KRC41890.1 threonine--tRNA ligase [Nocardioides sp. Root224]
MSDLKIVLAHADAREDRSVTTGTKAWELFAEDTSVIAARVNGALKDLAYVLADGDEVEGVAIDSKDGHDILRHSTAHVMAQAVQQLFPEAKLGIGPPIENGFYYDFDVETPFVPEDLAKIETAMRKIIKEGQRFERRVTTDHDAIHELQDEPYKIELIGLKGSGKSDDAAEGASVEVGAGELTIYDNVNRKGEVAWSDLCRGPHLPTTKRIPAFKLMRSAAAYWRGDEKNKQLQRIYGTAWESKEALDEHLHRIEEAERRDHRKLGRDLDLFSFPDEIGSGLPVFHPKGGVIKREMEDYVRRRHIEEGFEYVGTPHIAKEGLFYTSGHLPYYGEGMFPALDVDGMDYRLKAMNCPMHNLIFRSRQRSYRELPLRLFEFGSVYRHEKSGVIHGLTRVRGFAQDDSHSYVTKEQAPGEIKHLLEFCLGLFRDFGLDDFYLELSTRDDSKPDKFIGSDEDWEIATKVLEDVCIESGLELVPDPGGAAYYGPKVSVQARDAIGRTWQMSTIQYDFNQPSADRFDLEYVASDGTRQQPVMIHSAKFGSIERFIGVLVEHYAGAFPPWLAPVQVQAIPVADTFADYLYDVAKQMRAQGLRVEVDDSDDRMQKKIRNAQLQKVPFMMIAGADDVAAGAVSFRYRDGRQDNGVPIAEAIQRVVDAVASREQV